MSGDEKDEEYEVFLVVVLVWEGSKSNCDEVDDNSDCLGRGSGTGMDYGGFKEENELGSLRTKHIWAKDSRKQLVAYHGGI